MWVWARELPLLRMSTTVPLARQSQVAPETSPFWNSEILQSFLVCRNLGWVDCTPVLHMATLHMACIGQGWVRTLVYLHWASHCPLGRSRLCFYRHSSQIGVQPWKPSLHRDRVQGQWPTSHVRCHGRTHQLTTSHSQQSWLNRKWLLKGCS